jgi:hemerythrin-like metal-binding protein
MKLIQWLDADELGHHAIDCGHRDIVDALNKAIKAFNDRDSEACAAEIESAVDVTRLHFSHEEAVLLDLGYRGNDFSDHAGYHARLLGEVEKIAALCKKDRRREHLEARLAELIHFVVFEIRSCDKDLKRHLSGAKTTAKM